MRREPLFSGRDAYGSTDAELRRDAAQGRRAVATPTT